VDLQLWGLATSPVQPSAPGWSSSALASAGGNEGFASPKRLNAVSGDR
jgi:hypothetical protein